MVKRTISFNEEFHRYTDEDNNVYTSVTTLINKVTPPFDSDYWSKRKALEAGVSQQEILNNWKKINEESIERGNKTHKFLEDNINSAIERNIERHKLFSTAGVYLGGKEFTNVNIDILANSELAKRYPVIFNYLKTKIELGFKLYVEKRTYSYEHLVAGTIDCLLVKGKQFIIVDWKTNKKQLHFKSGYYKKVDGIETTQWVDKKEYMLSPIQHLENCKGVIYTCQLSLYAYILELWGLQCIELVLFHINNKEVKDIYGNILPQPEPKCYNINYEKTAAQLLLIHNKNLSTNNSNTNININSIPNFGIS